MLQKLIQRPLCIDLDGTLVRDHVIWTIARSAPWHVWLSPWWSLWKYRIASSTECDPKQLRWYKPLVTFLEQWPIGSRSDAGIKIYLVTGAPYPLALRIAQALPVFDEVWASSRWKNLVGARKARFLVRQFGWRGFHYIGDSWKDVPVWRAAAHIGIVKHAPSRLIEYMRQSIEPDQEISLI